MLYYGLALLIITFIIFVTKPKSLYSLIISMDLLAIVILIFADVLYIIKLDVYPYSSSLEYFLYRFMTKIPIGYFDIKVVVNVAFYIFLMSSVLFLGHDLKYVKRKNMRLMGLIFWGIIGGIDLLYLNSAHFSEKIYIMKYDAFKEVGGNMSFVLVLLDMKNNGIIINSIRSTDGNYIYLKEVEKGNCNTPLCKEESISLEEAIKQS